MLKQSVSATCLCTALALVAAAACNDDAIEVEKDARDVATTTAQDARQAATAGAAEGVTRLQVTLTGAAEVPGPRRPGRRGDSNGEHRCTNLEVCFEVTNQRVARPTGMHIHDGEPGKNGPILVPLATPAGSDTTTPGCANADAALIARITANPRNFYLNVHSQAHQQGAVRGQLSK